MPGSKYDVNAACTCSGDQHTVIVHAKEWRLVNYASGDIQVLQQRSIVPRMSRDSLAQTTMVTKACPNARVSDCVCYEIRQIV